MHNLLYYKIFEIKWNVLISEFLVYEQYLTKALYLCKSSWAHYTVNYNFTEEIQSTQYLPLLEILDNSYQQEMVREDDYDQPQSLFFLLIEKITHNSIWQLMNNYVKGKGKKFTRLSERYYKEFLSILFWKKLVFDYIRIYEKNVTIRMASNDTVETLMLLSKIEESTNVILRNVDEENETKDKKDYRIKQEM
ncbi:hypothetical protein C1645_819953 [Glomus cerebriforme]|uniref:Uncharacterized protein n=1 Tax=Glomus cerebriforme TaxID=658196 RepID=A0A397T6R7_9GLOM|nr:hypothetical protein C1645_819953 [Glomus cerebriforme]